MSATTASPAAQSVLLVIDVQESFRHRPYWTEADLPAFQSALRRLEAGCRARDIPVVHVFHVEDDGPFSLASGLVQPLAGFPAACAVRFEKHTHNAFTDTGLDLWLRRRGIGHLIVTGIRSEQCCETTTRVGADIGYAIDYVTEATLTFPMTHAGSGRVYSSEEIKAHTELVLDGRFARVTNVDGCLAGLGRA
jgi:nicotinamidase-related amidase